MRRFTNNRGSFLFILLLCAFMQDAMAFTTVVLPNNRQMRPVGWSRMATIEFMAGTVQVDDEDGGVTVGTLANEIYLRSWNSSASYAFAAGSVVRFERTGGVLNGYLARDTSLRIVYSSAWVWFRGNPAPVTFGYDGGVASGVLAQATILDGRNLPPNTLVSFSDGKLASSAPWSGPASGSARSTESKPPVPVTAPGAANWPGGFQDTPASPGTGSPGSYKTYTMTGPSFSSLLSRDYPRQNLFISLGVTYRKSGTVLDTVGINAAPAGAFEFHIDESGRPVFQIYDPGVQSPVRMASGWHILTAASALNPGVEAVVDILVGNGEVSLAVNGRVEKRVPLAVTLSGKPLYIGDIPDDDSWGAKYNIHPAMTGAVSVRYFGTSKDGR